MLFMISIDLEGQTLPLSLVIRHTRLMKYLPRKNLTGQKAGNVARIPEATLFPLKVKMNGDS